MRFRWHIVLACALFAIPVSAQEPAGTSRPSITTIPVFAHFVSWHAVPGAWATAATMPLRRDNPAGGYASADPDIIAQQNAEMSANGIVPMVSWWARDTYAGDAFLRTYLAQPGPPIGILYEAVGPGRMQEGADRGIHLDDPANANIFIDDMAHLQTEFFDKYPQERFFRIGGRPVVFVWITANFHGPFDKVVAQARTHAAFYLIGADFTVPFSIRPGLDEIVRGMDAMSAYGFYDPGRYGLDMPSDFLRDYAAAVPQWLQWLSGHAPGVRLLLPMGFAYDETRIPGRHGWVFRSSIAIARQYAEMVRGFIANPCGSAVLPYAYITSYNEHYEGTAIEPFEISRGEEGPPSKYLDIISQTFLHVPPPDDEARQLCQGKPDDPRR